MRRSIKSSAAGKSAAGTQCDAVTTEVATQTAHTASRRLLQLRIIVFGPLITIRFWREGVAYAAELAPVKPGSGSARGRLPWVAFTPESYRDDRTEDDDPELE